MRTAASIARRTLVVAVDLCHAVLAASAARGAGPVANLNAGVAGSSTPPPPPYTPPADQLPLATGKAKYLGSAHSNAQAPFFINYWNQVTPENAGKWGSVEGTRDVMNWTQLDTAYNLAKNNGFGHRHF